MNYNLNNPYESLKLKEFRYFLITRICLMLSMQAQAVVVGIQIYELTKDPLALGILGLVVAFPAIFVSLYAGYIADIYDRRKIQMICITGFLLCSIALFLFTFEPTQKYLGFSVIHIYIIMFFTGLAKGFVNPASFGLMGQIVPKELYSNSVLWGSSAFQIGLVTGPVLGGILYDYFGGSTTHFINSFVVIISLIAVILVKPKPVPEFHEKPPLVESIKEGLKFVFNNQIILGAITLDLFAVLFGGAVAMLPIFAKDVLNVGGTGLGILRTAPAIGATLMSIYLIYKPIKKNAGNILLSSVAGFGLCMILFGISKNFMLSTILLVFSGMFDEVSVMVRATIMQIMTPDNMRGRVSAVNSIFIGASNEIGEFESGFAARLMGLLPSVIFGGFMTLFVVILTSIKAKKLRKLDL